MGTIVKVQGPDGWSVFEKDMPTAMTSAATLTEGSVIAEYLVHDPIFGRLLNWLLLACAAVMIITFFPIWVVIIIYSYFAHHDGTMEMFHLAWDMLAGDP